MRLLLDTHVLIWWDAGLSLSDAALDAIRQADQVYVSSVSGWEIAIKKSLRRLETERGTAAAVAESGFEELPLRLTHAEALGELPPHHRDPFDRMLIAQAKAEGLTLVSRDRALRHYGIRVIEA